jgi:hypothetical protein
MALDLIAELEGLIAAFDRERIDYAICGGIALGIHGYPRATMDIDLLVQSADLERAIASARACGFDIPARKIIFGLRTNTPREVHRVSKLDEPTGRMMPCDIMVVAHEYEEVWKTRERLQWNDREVRVVSRAGLATMKRIAGRPQDLADLAKLEGRDDDEEV